MEVISSIYEYFGIFPLWLLYSLFLINKAVRLRLFWKFFSLYILLPILAVPIILILINTFLDMDRLDILKESYISAIIMNFYTVLLWISSELFFSNNKNSIPKRFSQIITTLKKTKLIEYREKTINFLLYLIGINESFKLSKEVLEKEIDPKNNKDSYESHLNLTFDKIEKYIFKSNIISESKDNNTYVYILNQNTKEYEVFLNYLEDELNKLLKHPDLILKKNDSESHLEKLQEKLKHNLTKFKNTKIDFEQNYKPLGPIEIIRKAISPLYLPFTMLFVLSRFFGTQFNIPENAKNLIFGCFAVIITHIFIQTFNMSKTENEKLKIKTINSGKKKIVDKLFLLKQSIS
tara:strand:- start:1273 stop:2319 length:1047 start_codon:yes stop_codon:yes gene_type:complete